MKVGDLVQYRGWQKNPKSIALGLVIEVRSEDSDFHKRIRVMWVGEEIPIQARVLSTSGKRITTWISPKHFEKI